MSINKLNANTYEAYFNGCGYSFEITRECGLWHIGRKVYRSLNEAISALQYAADHAISNVK